MTIYIFLHCYNKEKHQPKPKCPYWQCASSCFVPKAVPKLFKSIPQFLDQSSCQLRCIENASGDLYLVVHLQAWMESRITRRQKCASGEYPNYVEYLYSACCSLLGTAAECLYKQPFSDLKLLSGACFPEMGRDHVRELKELD